MRQHFFSLAFAFMIAAALAGAAPPAPCSTDPAAANHCPALGQREVVRAIVALEQTGASGTPAGENFAFDFFLTRPAIGPRVRWWGDVKVDSIPQQVNSQLVNMEQQFATAFGNLKV